MSTPTNDQAQWEDRYRAGETPWDTGKASPELMRVLAEEKIAPCRALEIGCGTGSSAVWLARQGFEVTGIDLSSLAILQAEKRAREAGVPVRFLTADVTRPPELGQFQFVFDRGCYHAVRRSNVAGYLATLDRVTAPGARVLVLTGNAKEPHDPGPPVVSAEEIRGELGRVLKVVRLREFRFDPRPGSGDDFLGWSCLLQKEGKGEEV